MPGPPPKKPEKRQRRNRRDVGLVVVDSKLAAELEAHPVPSGVLAATRDEWIAFWRSPVSELVMDADVPALERLFTLRDERRRCLSSARKGRIVEGSTGQPVLNPLYSHMAKLDGEIRQLEGQFGLTPMSRLRLGATFGEAKRSLADLNAEAEEAEGAVSDEDRFSVVIDAEAADSEG